ncbi:LysR family transcriptional regulator [Roseomonas gilardii subsp. gilardii]|uniref:LysR family transcriptional regulator n=1 Tax=Roseomonas gilardii TaxID=257708 RepID=UPI001FF96EE0|nr:LysR family transcriptional regulator [Roseomonas gilardii]UPG72152.1 LysR family transcriptional regulator [Roseomonas gilardii subsp. gilardii]
MIDLRLLRQFVAVAEELHFRRAAARLNISQPPLTAAVKRLEEEIGAVLLERGRSTIALTAAGRTLLEEARKLLDQAEAAITATRPRGGAGWCVSPMSAAPCTGGFRWRSEPSASAILG